jgi:hypothetical protein
MATAKNKEQGAFFERVFEHAATMQGILAQKQPLAFRYLRGGKVLPIKAELDFSLVSRASQMAFVDTKAFAGSHFTYSQLNETQLKRATRYNEWGIASGFVVLFVGSSEVAYFEGQAVAKAGPRTRFEASAGLRLGSLTSLKVSSIFEAAPRPMPLPRFRL